MTSPPVSTGPTRTAAAPPPRWMGLGCIIGLLLVGSIMIGMLTLAVAAFRAFQLGPEAHALREAAREHFVESGHWHPVIEVRLGPLWCGILREVVIQAANDPDATAVLRAARSLQVGVYQVSEDKGLDEAPASFLRDATRRMTERGWTRVVAVVDGGSTVAVFVPETWEDGEREVEFGIVVRNQRELVVAIVDARVESLFELVRRHSGAWSHGKPATRSSR